MDDSLFINVLKNALVLKNFLQLAHWGTRGMFFYSYHELFADLYSKVGAGIDEFAELASIKGVAVNSEIFAEPVPTITSSSPELLVNGALNLLDQYKSALQGCCKAAEENYERGVANAVDDRLLEVDKIQYLLEASLPVESLPRGQSPKSESQTSIISEIE